MVENISILSLSLFLLIMAYFIKLLVHIPLNRMVFQREYIGILQKLVCPCYQCYAISIASFFINRLPSSILGLISPWEKVNHMSPFLTAFRTFGSACYPYLRPYNKQKLQPRSMECVFLGYPPLSKGYLCLDLNTNSVYIVCYALFNEDVFPFKHKSDLITSHVPFSIAILDSKWFPNTLPLLHLHPLLIPLALLILQLIVFLWICFSLLLQFPVFLIHLLIELLPFLMLILAYLLLLLLLHLIFLFL